MEQQIVIFKLAEEYFGIEISTVESIVKLQKITRIPHAPDYMKGVINLRGEILPVMDLEKRFNQHDFEMTSETRIVVINIGGVKIGMIVSGVSEVLNIEDSVIEKTPPILTTMETEFITGVVKLEARLVILLDLARVLSLQEMNAINELVIL